MNKKAIIFKEIIDSIENDDMKVFAKECIKTIPAYFWDVGASSSGRYHPAYALGDLGLARHTCALVRLLNHTFAIECMNKWTSRERDMLRIAGMMHDSRKSGSQEEFEKNKYTKFDHPLLAAEVIRSFDGKYLNHDEIECIANAISSHMGEWNTSTKSTIVLPTPQNRFQKILHWADYLASRKDIEVKFDTNEEQSHSDDPATWIFPFGKYKGKTFNEILKTDLEYLQWMKYKSDMEKRDPLKTFLEKLVD